MQTTDTNEGSKPAEATASVHPTSARRPFWTAALLAVALIPLFFVQVFVAKLLVTPWYLPIGGTVAALVVLWSMGRPRRVPRVAVALLCVALACLEWFFVVKLTVLPVYAGPVVSGSAVPGFHAQLADGTEIDETFFQSGQPTALIFFQGRWCPFCMTQLTELENHQQVFAGAGAKVVVVSIEGLEDAAATQKDFPHLTVVSDERRELSNAIDLVNRNSAPGGGDSAAPTILLIDKAGTVQSLYRPKRIIERPSAAELVKQLRAQQAS